ncbi:hypothetical protein JCM21900_003583, partial [Sporobolomyces salmonicolor]
LQVLAKTGTEKQKRAAQKVIPIRKNGHLLLITLLISNMIFNEALPVVSENILGGGVQAVVISTVLIVIFSEIIPQSVCSRFGLQIGAAMVWPVRVLIYGLFVVAWPVAKVLELVLGAHSGIVYRRAELKELVAMHAQTSGHGDLQDDTVAIVGATLDLQSKVVRDAMTPLSSVFMLPITATLDYETLGKVLKAGHSRIPVYEEKVVETEEGVNTKRKIIGVLLTKQLILLDPEDAVPLRDIPMNTLPLVSEDLPLLQMMNTFQLGRSHMAIVCVRRSRPALEEVDSMGARTATEDELERGEAGKKDNDGSSADSRERFLHGLFRRSRSGSGSSIATTTAVGNEGQKAQKEPEGEKVHEKGSLGEAMVSRLSLADLDDEHPQGVITLEDVIEELIGEEILDETDADGAQPPSMLHYIPPEAYGKVGNLSGPPPAPSALLAHQAELQQHSSSSYPTRGMGIAGAVGRVGKGMARSRSAPGKSRVRENSGGVAPGVGNTMMGDGTPVQGSGGVGIAGALGVSMGAFGGGRRRSASPAGAVSGNVSSSADTPTTASTRFATPKVVDFAQLPSSSSPASPGVTAASAASSISGQPYVSEPQPLSLIRERSRSESDPSHAHPTSTTVKSLPASAPSLSLPPILRHPSPNSSASASTLPSPAQNTSPHAIPFPLPTSSLLSDAVLLERGRRVLLAQGADPSQLNLLNLRRVGAARSQPGSRSATPAPGAALASGSGSGSGHLTPASEVGDERGGRSASASGTRPKGTAFKSPVGGRPLPHEGRVTPSPRASVSGSASAKGGGNEEQEKAED